MYGTTTVNNLEINGNIMYQGQMLTLQGTTTSSAIYTQDSGVVSFGLGIIIVILSVMLIGFIFNHLNSKKPWRSY